LIFALTRVSLAIRTREGVPIVPSRWIRDWRYRLDRPHPQSVRDLVRWIAIRWIRIPLPCIKFYALAPHRTVLTSLGRTVTRLLILAIHLRINGPGVSPNTFVELWWRRPGYTADHRRTCAIRPHAAPILLWHGLNGVRGDAECTGRELTANGRRVGAGHGEARTWRNPQLR
jgi:hypothetical protein